MANISRRNPKTETTSSLAKSAEPSISSLQILSTAMLASVVAGVLVKATLTLEEAVWVASTGLVLYWLIEAPKTNRIGQVILAAGAILTITVLLRHPTPQEVLIHVLAESSFVIGLFIALSFLREAADTSDLIKSCGEQMIKQPAGRRYVSLTFGSHLVAIVLNFGVMPLLGIMINKGNTLAAANGNADLRAERQRSMMMAVFRGFALMTAWSPLSIVFAIAQSILFEVPWWQLVGWQFLITMILLLFGVFLESRTQNEESSNSPTGQEHASGSGNPILRLSMLIAAIVGISILVAESLEVRIVIGAMLTVPAAAWVWLTVQQAERGIFAPAVAAKRLGARMTHSFPASRNEVALVGGSMYAGMVGASLLPTDAIAATITSIGLPPVVIAIGMAWGMMILAQFGISHIVTLAFMSGAIPILAGSGLDPIVTVSGLMAAWALSICTTPVGAGVLLISRLSETPVQTIIRDWNAKFVIGGALIIAVWMIFLALILPL